MPEIISADRIASAAGGFEPQRRNNWLLNVPLPGDADASKVLTFSLMRFPFPKEHTTVTVIDYLNEQRKVAGKTTYDTFPLVVKDYVDQETYAGLKNWRRRVFVARTGVGGLARNYKVDGDLQLFAPDGTSARDWTLVGLWPSDLEGTELDMSNGEQVEITCTLQVDYVDFQD